MATMRLRPEQPVTMSLKPLAMAAPNVACTCTTRQPSPLFDLYGHINCKPILLLHVPQGRTIDLTHKSLLGTSGNQVPSLFFLIHDWVLTCH